MYKNSCVLCLSLLLLGSLNSNTITQAKEESLNPKIVFENISLESLTTNSEDINDKSNLSLTVKLNSEVDIPPMTIDESKDLNTIQNERREYFDLVKNYYKRENSRLSKDLDLSPYESIYTSEYSPFLSIQTDWNTISDHQLECLNYLAESDNVEQIYVNQLEKNEESISTSKWCTGVTDYVTNTNPNLTGEGIIVGVLEVGIANKNHESLIDTDIEVRDEWYYPETVTEHATLVSAIIAGNRGVAPKAKVLSVEISGDPVSEIDWLMDRNVNVINMSYGEKNPTGVYNSNSAYVDYIADTYGITFVAAAGNEGEGSGYVTNPGLGYNVLTVGACDPISKYYMGFSSSNVITGPRKPNIIAPGDSFFLEEFNGLYSGTSFSAAFTTGIVALLMQKDKSSIIRPQRAIGNIMTCAEKPENQYQGSGLNDYVGTGAINFTRIMKTISSNSFFSILPTSTNIKFNNLMLAEKDKLLKVSVVWFAKSDGTVKGTKWTDYDIYLYDEDDNLIAKQETHQDCIEYIEVVLPKLSNYRLEAHQLGSRDYNEKMAISCNIS